MFYSIVKNFLCAVSTLTILPVGSLYRKTELSNSVLFFPLVGSFIGMIISSVFIFINKIYNNLTLSSILSVLLLVVLTGALHLDGLADIADAIMAPGKDRNVVLKDPRHGTAGVTCICFVILTKIFLFTELKNNIFQILVIAMTLSRYNISFLCCILNSKYLRNNSSSSVFIGKIKKYKLIFPLSFSFFLLLSLLEAKLSVIIFLSIHILGVMLVYILKKLTNHISGDVLGTVCELTEIFLLILLVKLV